MFARRDDIVIAIAVIVLVIGTATGSAYAMLGLAAAGLMLSVALYVGHPKQLASLVVLAAASAAVAAGIAISLQ